MENVRPKPAERVVVTAAMENVRPKPAERVVVTAAMENVRPKPAERVVVTAAMENVRRPSPQDALARRPRIDVDLGSKSSAGWSAAGQHDGHVIETDSGGDERPRIDGAPDEYASIVPTRPGEALRMPTAVTSLRAMVRVSTRLGLPARPM